MTTPSSPSSLSFSQINTEIENTSNSALNMGNSKLRGLFQDFSGEIAMSSGRNKTYTVKAVFSTVGATTFIVPTNITSIVVKLWGAGGGGGDTDTGGNAANGEAEGGSGGSGAYVTATIAVTPGETLNIFVPSGGLGSAAALVSGAGGSWAGIFRSTSPLVIAGGGGGGGPGRDTGQGINNGAGGGGGGGLNGANGGSAQGTVMYGRGGTTTAGGAGGNAEAGATDGQAGTLYKGGDGGATTGAGKGNNGAGAVLGVATYGEGGDRANSGGDRSGGGGGGGGYYGGGGGGQGGNGNNTGGCGGGGGSSFYSGLNVTNQSSTAGNSGAGSVAAGCLNDTVAPNNNDIDYIAGVGIGLRCGVGVNAGPGLVVIRWAY